MPYRKGDRSATLAGKRTRREWYIAIPTPIGGRVNRSAQTEDKRVAQNYEVMLADIGPRGKREFDLLDRVINGGLSLAELYIGQ